MKSTNEHSDEIFEITDRSLSCSGDSYAFQAVDRVFIVDMGTEEYDEDGELKSFIGNEVTYEDIEDGSLADCGETVKVVINKDCKVKEILSIEEEER